MVVRSFPPHPLIDRNYASDLALRVDITAPHCYLLHSTDYLHYFSYPIPQHLCNPRTFSSTPRLQTSPTLALQGRSRSICTIHTELYRHPLYIQTSQASNTLQSHQRTRARFILHALTKTCKCKPLSSLASKGFSAITTRLVGC